VYHEFHHQLVDVLSDRDTHHSIVSKLHTRAVISQEVIVAQMSSTGGSDRGSSLLTVLDLEDKPHKLRELITAMMEEENVRSLAEEMTAMMNKTDQGITKIVCVKHPKYFNSDQEKSSENFERFSGKATYIIILPVIIMFWLL